LGSLCVVSAIFIWSSLGVVIRFSGVDVHILIFYSALVSLPLQGAIILWRGYQSDFPRGRELVNTLILGPVLLLNTLLFFYALKNTTIANALLTHYIAPVIVVFLAAVFLNEPLTKKILAAIALSMTGLWVLLGFSPVQLVVTAFQEPGRETLGIMSGLLSGFAYAVLILLVRVFAQHHNPLVLTFIQNLMVFLILIPFIREFPVNAIWSFLIMGVIHSTVAPVLYFKGLSTVRANRAAILGYLEPVSAIIFGMILLGEYPPPVSLAGGVLILYSGYITLKDEKGDLTSG
jgi:drug/metabolite transporter (DMT)-like permease